MFSAIVRGLLFLGLVRYLVRVYVQDEMEQRELTPDSATRPRGHLRYSNGQYTVTFDEGTDPHVVETMFNLVKRLNERSAS